jgi:hypothetical protein
MKIIALAIVSCFLLGNAMFAQNEWAPLGAKWYYTMTNSSNSDINFNYFESVKDTSINNIHCKKLSRLHETCDDRSKSELMYEENRKVYFYDEFANEFNLLYDFNKLPDQIWYIKVNNHGINFDSLLVHVDSITSVLMNNQSFKVLYTTIGNSPNWVGFSGKITEKLGHEKNMFPFISKICDLNFNHGLRCYEDSILGLFQTGIAPLCDYSSVDINEYTSSEKYPIFPNPVTDELCFNNINNTTIYITIYNIYGSIVQTIITNDNKINISNLKNDIYLIKFKNSSNKIILIDKIIKY